MCVAKILLNCPFEFLSTGGNQRRRRTNSKESARGKHGYKVHVHCTLVKQMPSCSYIHISFYKNDPLITMLQCISATTCTIATKDRSSNIV